jgi:hypothetical protein
MTQGVATKNNSLQIQVEKYLKKNFPALEKDDYIYFYNYCKKYQLNPANNEVNGFSAKGKFHAIIRYTKQLDIYLHHVGKGLVEYH